MAGKIIADQIEHSTAGSLDTSYVVQGSAKAWINFDGTGTPAARDSFNFASITDNGAGDYTITVSNAFNNANYASTGMCGANGTTFGQARDVFFNVTAPTTTAFRINTKQSNDGSNNDTPQVHTSSNGDLA
jgi:hypothetical protein